MNNSPPEIPKLGISDALLAVEEEKSEIEKVFELLLDESNIGHNTELNENEILAFSVIGTLSEKYPKLVLKDFLIRNLIYRVSKGRGGRKEIVKIAQRALDPHQMEQSGFGRWFGGRRPPSQVR